MSEHLIIIDDPVVEVPEATREQVKEQFELLVKVGLGVSELSWHTSDLIGRLLASRPALTSTDKQ